jgi:hypothetical protein
MQIPPSSSLLQALSRLADGVSPPAAPTKPNNVAPTRPATATAATVPSELAPARRGTTAGPVPPAGGLTPAMPRPRGTFVDIRV